MHLFADKMWFVEMALYLLSTAILLQKAVYMVSSSKCRKPERHFFQLQISGRGSDLEEQAEEELIFPSDKKRISFCSSFDRHFGVIAIAVALAAAGIACSVVIPIFEARACPTVLHLYNESCVHMLTTVEHGIFPPDNDF
jgi:hypothetical protein